MATIKKKSVAKRSASSKELNVEIKKLRAKVAALEGEAEHWKKKAEKQRSRAKKIAKRAEKAIAHATRIALKQPSKTREVPIDHVPAVVSPYVDTPDDTWTVARLRSMAREQGIVNYSRLRKDQLLGALSED